MATTTAQTLVNRVRRRVKDFPDTDVTTASMASNGTTMTVADSSVYHVNERLDVGLEVMTVTAQPTSTTLTVLRGSMGTTAAAVASGAAILRDPKFYSFDILELLGEAIDNAWPYLYREVVDTSSIVPDGATYEFSVPTVTDISMPMRHVYRIDVKYQGATDYIPRHDWLHLDAPTPILKFREPPLSGSTIRVRGYAPFARPASLAATLDARWPYNAEGPLVKYVASELAAEGEAFRVRHDKGPIDQREQATRPGSSLNYSRDRFQRWFEELARVAMPPMSKHLTAPWSN